MNVENIRKVIDFLNRKPYEITDITSFEGIDRIIGEVLDLNDYDDDCTIAALDIDRYQYERIFGCSTPLYKEEFPNAFTSNQKIHFIQVAHVMNKYLLGGESIASATHKCICDFYTVLLVRGCQCGGK